MSREIFHHTRCVGNEIIPRKKWIKFLTFLV